MIKKFIVSVMIVSFAISFPAGSFAFIKNFNDMFYISKDTSVLTLNKKSEKIKKYVKTNAVIAHRGSIFWTPEETEAAYRWARNIGADYLELDLQMTKDSVLIALHDANLKRTTNVKQIFPDRASSPVSLFTLKELRMLDAGSSFNTKNPERACLKFQGQKIATLEEVIKIAEGYWIKKDKEGNPVKKRDEKGNWNGFYVYERDPKDNGNRPGIYPETKNPILFPGIEKVLARQLSEMGWLITEHPQIIHTYKGKIGVANTDGRVILQTFSRKSAVELEKYIGGIPKCFLVSTSGKKINKETVIERINFAVKHNFQIIGPNKNINFDMELCHQAGLLIHPYSFDSVEQLKKYHGDYFYEKDESVFENPHRIAKKGYRPNPYMFIDGVFTNRADLSLKYQHRKHIKSAQSILNDLGYHK